MVGVSESLKPVVIGTRGFHRVRALDRGNAAPHYGGRELEISGIEPRLLARPPEEEDPDVVGIHRKRNGHYGPHGYRGPFAKPRFAQRRVLGAEFEVGNEDRHLAM